MPSLEILGIKINKVDNTSLLELIKETLNGKNKIKISYANANTANLAAKKPGFREHLNSFDIIHPDGVGIYLASKFLHKAGSFPTRFTGSDFYPILAKEAIKNKWKLFFFGHSNNTLEKIKSHYPALNICGYAEGYNFNPVKIANQVNNKNPDILVVGLGQPLQEELILFYKNDFNCKVIIAVGDGIKIFAGEKKRGPIFLQKIGMEWLARYIHNPIKYFKRYIIGNPLFLYRIFRAKLSKFEIKP